jgi:hypothetical protein
MLYAYNIHALATIDLSMLYAYNIERSGGELTATEKLGGRRSCRPIIEDDSCA